MERKLGNGVVDRGEAQQNAVQVPVCVAQDEQWSGYQWSGFGRAWALGRENKWTLQKAGLVPAEWFLGDYDVIP